jgi:hypothetical protein
MDMASLDISLKAIMSISGAIAAAVVDITSGMTLGVAGGGSAFDPTIAAAGNTDVIRAKMRTVEMLQLPDGIEDILITLDSQYHLIRPLTSRAGKGLFLYVALSRKQSNLALARHQLRQVDEHLEL